MYVVCERGGVRGEGGGGGANSGKEGILKVREISYV